MRMSNQTGIIAAVGIILGAAGIGFGVYRWRRSIGTVSFGEARFMRSAMQMNAELLALGRIAGVQAAHDEVRDFAQLLVEDHSQEQSDLAGIAAYLGVPVATVISRRITKLAEKLKTLDGDAIDLAFMKTMVATHEVNVDLFKRIAEKGRTAEVKAYAHQFLARLEKHLAAAKSVAAGLSPQEQNHQTPALGALN
ncbi:MAG: DUF4142 domain-containing protein [Candidatus Sericytochromatia bacterium]|nr:DUF4142 domain-containing protein [Candidatus Sericytochromatia bacterium]